MKTFKIEFDYTPLATVQVDEQKAAKPIREMVDFWGDSEYRLQENGGDYTRTWLKQLGSFILRRRRPPQDDEGWFSLNGTYGIRLLSWEEHEPDEDQIEIEEVKP